MNKKILYVCIKYLIIGLITTISVRTTHHFLIAEAGDKGIFFTSLILLNKLDFLMEVNLLWSMPISQFFNSIFSILEKKYLIVYLFLIYFFHYYISISIIESYKKSILNILIFSISYLLYLPIFHHDIEQIIYSTYISVVAYLLYLKEEENSIKNNIILSVIIGISFLIRSPLVILPPILSIYEIVKNRNIKNSIILLIIPYLTLLLRGFLSYNINQKFEMIELQRINLNILTGLNFITHTVEGNKELIEKILKQNIETTNFLINFINSALKRFLFFIKTYNVLFIISTLTLIFKRNKFSLILYILNLAFIIIHIPFSIEKRYLFPSLNLLSIYISIFFSKNTTKNIKDNLKSIILISIIPFIITSILVLRYIIFKEKKFHTVNSNINNLLKGIESLYYLKRNDAIKYFENYVKDEKKEYLYTTHIKDILSIIKGNIPLEPSPPLLFNTKFLIFLKLLSLNLNDEASIYLKLNWNEISYSYIRDPTNKIENKINSELNNYIKENSMIFPSFVLISENSKDIKKICNLANIAIKNINKKHKFDCNYYVSTPTIEIIPNNYNQYINIKCLNKYYNKDIEKIIIDIVDLQRKKEYEKALKIIDNNINKYKIYKFYVKKGNILHLKSDFEKSNKYFLKAIELCPCAVDAIVGTICSLKNLNKDKEKNDFIQKIKNECKFIKLKETEKECK